MKKYNYCCIALAFMIVVAFNATAWSKKYHEELNKTYPISASGRIDLENINGNVQIQVWDRNEVQVDAIKYAESEKGLAETQIRIDANADQISIKTEYAHSSWWAGNNDPASVEYTLTIPKNASLNDINLVNGNLEVSGTTGNVTASTVNGELHAIDLSGETKLSTVNGAMEVSYSQLNVSRVSLSSVNGSLELKLPSNADAKIKASTVNGGIANDFGLEVDKGHWVGQDLSGVLGSGRTRIDLSNVNGKITILKN